MNFTGTYSGETNKNYFKENHSVEEKTYDVTVAGHICLDIIPEMSASETQEIGKFFKPGKLIQVGNAKISTGGPVSNTGLAVTRLGLNVAFMARVGDDPFGKLVVDLLAREGHAAGVLSSPEDCTSYTIAISPPGIDRIFLHYPGANDAFSASDLDRKIIAQSKIFHFGYPPLMARCYQDGGEELMRMLQIAQSEGVTISLDMALPDPNSTSALAPWKDILIKALPHVDVFLPSIEEVLFILDRDRYFEMKKGAGDRDFIDMIDPGFYSRLARQILEMGCKIVGLKTAHRGVYILTGSSDAVGKVGEVPADIENWSNRELWCPAFQVDKIASATGSGDSLIAGFLAAYSRGQTIEKTLKYANCTGFQNLHALDAVSGIRDWTETTRLIEEEDLPMIDVPLNDTPWKWDKRLKLWVGEKDKNYECL